MGTCWIPDSFLKKDLKDEDAEARWADYMDSQSEVMRAECDTRPWMEICNIDLYWLEVDCDIFTKTTPKKASKKKGIILPTWLVVIVQVLETLWELNVIFIVTLPWWAILATVALVDWIIDWIWMGLFVWWCRTCAAIFIWIFNIAFLPFHIGGWLQRFRLETYGLLVDGWMLFFRGSGCYISWGRHCWFKRKLKDRNFRTIWDIPIMNREDETGSIAGELSSYFMPPDLNDPVGYAKIKAAHRRGMLVDAMPNFDKVLGLVNTLVSLVEF